MRRFFYFVLACTAFLANACAKDDPFAPAEYSVLIPRAWYESAVEEMSECVGRKPLAKYSDITWRQVSGLVSFGRTHNAMGMAFGHTIYIASEYQNTRVVIVHEAAHVLFTPNDVGHTDEIWQRCIGHFAETWNDGVTTSYGIKKVPFDSPDGRTH